MTIKTKAINLSSIIFLAFILILPVLGKGIDYQESFAFYGLPILLSVNYILFGRHKVHLPSIKPQIILISLFLTSVIFSTSIGTSYYLFITFITILLIFNLAFVYLPPPNIFESGLIVSSILFSIVTILYKLFVPAALPTDYTDNIFIQYWGHSYVSDYLVLCIPVIIYRLNKYPKIFSLCSLLLVSTAVFITNSRSSIVALITGLILLKPTLKLQQKTKYFIVSFLLLGLTYIFFFNTTLKSPNGSRPEYWTQAIKGFLSSPLVGVGPGNFNILNRLYRDKITNNSNYAHNSILESLSEKGIFYSLVAFTTIFIGLKFQSKNNHLFFVIGTTSFVNSLFDPSWSSPGILTITLIIIFWNIQPQPNPKSKLFIGILSTVVFLFLLSKLTSDFLYAKGNYHLSLKFDPFNPNSLLQIIDKNPEKIRLLYKNDPGFLSELSNISQLPQNESDFLRSIQLDPLGSINQQVRLAFYYQNSGQWIKLQNILEKIYSHLTTTDIPFNQSMMIARASYGLGIHEWSQKQPDKSIFYLKKASVYARHWSHFEIELASAYWHNHQPDLAKKQLESCQQSPASSTHCQQYLQKISVPGLPTPGTFSQTIYSLYPPLTESEIYQYQMQIR